MRPKDLRSSSTLERSGPNSFQTFPEAWTKECPSFVQDPGKVWTEISPDISRGVDERMSFGRDLDGHACKITLSNANERASLNQTPGKVWTEISPNMSRSRRTNVLRTKRMHNVDRARRNIVLSQPLERFGLKSVQTFPETWTNECPSGAMHG